MHVIMINPVAKAMFNINYKNDPVGVPLVRVIPTKINDLIKSITGNMVWMTGSSTENGKRILSVHVSHIPDEGTKTMEEPLLLLLI